MKSTKYRFANTLSYPIPFPPRIDQSHVRVRTKKVRIFKKIIFNKPRTAAVLLLVAETV